MFYPLEIFIGMSDSGVVIAGVSFQLVAGVVQLVAGVPQLVVGVVVVLQLSSSSSLRLTRKAKLKSNTFKI